MTVLNRAVAALTWRQTLRTRKFLIALLVSLLPALLGILLLVNDLVSHASLKSAFDFSANFRGIVDFIILGATVPAVALLLASGTVADEVEDRTLGYLLVRPVARRVLYTSKLVPVAAAAAMLAVLQVVTYALMRLLALAFVGAGGTAEIAGYDGVTRSFGDGVPIAAVLPAAALAAALAAIAFTALFGFVSLLSTRHHFIANLAVLLFVELPFGNLGGGGLGVLTVTFQSRSLLQGLDYTRMGTVPSPAPWPLALPALLLLAAAWWWAGTARMARRDFNITSAAS